MINNASVLKTIHVMVDQLSDRLKAKLDQLIQTYGITIRTHEVDLAKVKHVKLTGHISAAAYYRILAAEILPQDTQKVLYLDSDLIVRGAIAPLYDLDIANHPLAACGQRIVTTKKRLELNGNTYFNSGVMLMNLEAWRRDDVGQKALQFIHEFPQMIKFHDQDALNKVVDGHFVNLDKKWNSLVDLYAGTSQVTPESMIVHFVGSLKPWQSWCIQPDKEIYWSYLKRSPWSDAIPLMPRDVRQTFSAARSLAHQVRAKYA